jgi:hypothetical protein
MVIKIPRQARNDRRDREQERIAVKKNKLAGKNPFGVFGVVAGEPAAPRSFSARRSGKASPAGLVYFFVWFYNICNTEEKSCSFLL